MDEINRRSKIGENEQSGRMVLLRNKTEELRAELNNLINTKKESAAASIAEHMADIEGRKAAAMAAREEAAQRKQEAAEKLGLTFQTEQDAINYANEWRLAAEIQHNNQVLEAARRASAAKAQVITDTMSNLSTLMNAKSKKLFKIGKAAAISSALINTYLAVTKTMSATPYPWNIPLAIAQSAAGLVQVQNIKSQSFRGQAHSGLDNVPGEGTYLLQKGEMVLDPGTSDQVRRNITNNSSERSMVVNINTTIDLEEMITSKRQFLYNTLLGVMNEEGVSFS